MSSDVTFKMFKDALMHAFQVSENYAEVAVVIELIALDLGPIFRRTLISKKGLSYTVGQMGTHYISLRGLVRCLDTIIKARLKNFNRLTAIGCKCSSSSIVWSVCFFQHTSCSFVCLSDFP